MSLSVPALIAVAQTVGDRETQRDCESILKQEAAMAAWLHADLPQTVLKHLIRSASELDDAKR
jgi:ferritin-like metal-binding protein YciE